MAGWNETRWLKLPEEEIREKGIYAGDLGGRFAYFRCEAALPKGCSLHALITANSRYRLFVNGQAVLSGPCKGDLHRQYYEEVALDEYLIEGKNVFAAQVLYNDPYIAGEQTDERAAIYGVISPAAYVDLPGPLSVAGVRGHVMFLYALLDAEKLMNALGRTGLASEYRTRREKLCTRIMECCYDAEKGLFREGPAFRQYTRHAQAWAVFMRPF